MSRYPFYEGRNLCGMGRHVFDIGLEQTGDCHLIAAKAKAPISVERLGRDRAEKGDKLLARVGHVGQEFVPILLAVLADEFGIVRSSVMIAMGVELGQQIRQDVFRRLDVGEVPADQVGHQVVGAPRAQEDFTSLLRQKRREFSQDAISGLLQAIKELRLANVRGNSHDSVCVTSYHAYLTHN